MPDGAMDGRAPVGTALAARAFTSWHRADATLEGDDVVVDLRRSAPYSPLREDDLLFRFARIEVAADIPPFVRRYGPLWTPADAARGHEREWIALWLMQAGIVRWALRLYDLIDLAELGGDTALERLRDELGQLRREPWILTFPGLSDGDPLAPTRLPADARAPLVQATDAVADLVNHGLDFGHAVGEARLVVLPAQWFDEDARAGRWVLAGETSTLLGHLYYRLASTILAQQPVRECEECGGLFPVADPRQRFCSPAHASRRRVRLARRSTRRAATAGDRLNQTEE